MPVNTPIGIIVLRPSNDPSQGTIDFLAIQDPTQADPEKAKITARKNQFVTWLIENRVDADIDVKINFVRNSPFNRDEFEEDVEDYSNNHGPGIEDIRAKIKNNADIQPYKYTISAHHSRITFTDIDPLLEVEDDMKAP